APARPTPPHTPRRRSRPGARRAAAGARGGPVRRARLATADGEGGDMTLAHATDDCTGAIRLANRVAQVANGLQDAHAGAVDYYRLELWDALAEWREVAGIPGETWPVDVEPPPEPEVDPYGGPDWTPRTAKKEGGRRWATTAFSWATFGRGCARYR